MDPTTQPPLTARARRSSAPSGSNPFRKPARGFSFCDSGIHSIVHSGRGPPHERQRTSTYLEAAAKKNIAPRRAAVGFLLLDASLRPLSFNAEAIQVLGYPDTIAARHLDVFLAGKLRSSLTSQQPSDESPLVTEFQSGRRRYLCRAFVVDSQANDPSHPRIAVLLERDSLGSIPVSRVCERFHLTRRERDALQYLLQGLSSKEIANRMDVSPNTVKTFLRLIMIKMGVSSRAAIVAKVISFKP